MSSRKRSRDSEDRGDRKRHKESKHDVEKLKKQARKLNQEVQKLKHLETFSDTVPWLVEVAHGVPYLNQHLDKGDDACDMIHIIVSFAQILVQGAEEYKPEDCIPADPGNEDARDFLAHAPTKGLWMPLGKEVKVMQCWRCKRYGHRTGDRECPFFIKGNQKLEQFRVAHEDPMYDLIRENKRNEKETRIQQLQQLLQDTTSSDSDSSSSSSSTSDRKKRKHKKKDKKKDKKKRKKRRKHKSSKTSDCSESN